MAVSIIEAPEIISTYILLCNNKIHKQLTYRISLFASTFQLAKIESNLYMIYVTFVNHHSHTVGTYRVNNNDTVKTYNGRGKKYLETFFQSTRSKRIEIEDARECVQS